MTPYIECISHLYRVVWCAVTLHLNSESMSDVLAIPSTAPTIHNQKRDRLFISLAKFSMDSRGANNFPFHGPLLLK
jgi:hypothetical protein